MMAFCKHRVMDRCGKDNRPCIFSEDCFEPEERKPLTNADHIRSMSDEDLAWELMLWRVEAVAKHHGVSSGYPDTQKTILEWLQQPANEKPQKRYCYSEEPMEVTDHGSTDI